MNDLYHVYLDLDVINNDYENKGYPILRFEETRNNPFLEGDSSEYFCSIVRFTIQTGKTLPVFIPRILVGQADVNLTIYVVSLRYKFGNTTYTGSARVIYTPDNKTTPAPVPPLLEQDISSTYYYVYNYGTFIAMVNTAFQTAFMDLRLQIPEAFDQLGLTMPPFLDFDTSTNRVVLYADQIFYDEFFTKIAKTNPIEIYFNERLFDLFVGLSYSYVSKVGDMNYKVRVVYNNMNSIDKKIAVGPDPTGVESRSCKLIQMYQ